MVQVKMFLGINDEVKLEKDINTWFKENSNIEIVKILQTQSGRLDRHVVVSIFYKILS